MGACTSLVEDVTVAFRQRLQVQAVALDIQAAYDSVWKAGLLEKLVAKGGERNTYLMDPEFPIREAQYPRDWNEPSRGGIRVWRPPGITPVAYTFSDLH